MKIKDNLKARKYNRFRIGIYPIEIFDRICLFLALMGLFILLIALAAGNGIFIKIFFILGLIILGIAILIIMALIVSFRKVFDFITCIDFIGISPMTRFLLEIIKKVYDFMAFISSIKRKLKLE